MLIARPVVFATLSMVALALGTGPAGAQDFPNRPIRIVTGSIGGGNDTAARLIAQGITGPLGQQVIIENRATIVTAETVAKALPDGYTLLLAGDILWIGPLLRDEKARAQQPDPIKDFSPITMLASAPNVVVVHPSSPAKSIKELIALAKSKAGGLNYGTSTPGGTPHLGGEMFNTMAGVKLVGVPYKGSGDIAAALIANQVDVGFLSAGSVAAHIKSARLRALAVTSLQPSGMAPGLPTVSESGLPGYELVGIDAMYAPAKTPAPVIRRLNQEIVRFLKTPEAREKYLSIGGEIVGSTPQEHAAKIKSSMVSMAKVIKDAGIRIN
jgi:tripartite-type tricarboxylate transporter receptor subunit TctC